MLLLWQFITNILEQIFLYIDQKPWSHRATLMIEIINQSTGKWTSAFLLDNPNNILAWFAVLFFRLVIFCVVRQLSMLYLFELVDPKKIKNNNNNNVLLEQMWNEKRNRTRRTA